MQPKLNLLFITYTHSNGGGAENVLTTLVNNLDPQKYNITIQEIDTYDIKKEPINSNIILRKHPLRKIYGKFDFFAATNFLFLYHNPKILKSVFNWNNFDIVISWNYQLPSFALLAFDKEYKISHFHTDIYDLDIKKYPERKNDFERQVKVWEIVDKISTISNKSKKSVIDICPQFNNKIGFIHNGANLQIIIEKSKLVLEKKVDCFLSNFVKMISVGRLEERKNITLTFKSLAILNNKGLDFEYFILGKGELFEQLQFEAKSLGINDKVHFMGYIQNPYPYLNAADILCVSSFAEGWPTVIVEAMCLAKPFVTTPVAGASEELANNNTCGLVADWTPEDFAEKLETLIKDKSLREKMGKTGSEHIKNYNIERSVEEFETLIKDAKKLEQRNTFYVDLKNKFIYCICFASNLVKMTDNFFAIKTHLSNFFKNKKILSLLKFIYRCITSIIQIILAVLLFIPRFLVGIIYCGTNGR